MTIPALSILLAPDASGTAAAFAAVGGVNAQGVVDLDDSGHIRRSAPTYRLFVPAGAAAANKVYFDLFNATGTARNLKVISVKAIKDGSVAVTGVLSVKLYLTRTSAIGTAGTAATADNATLTAPTISKHRPADAALPAGVTARLAPTGGATAGAVLAERHIFSEETSAASYDPVEFVSDTINQPIWVPENTGIRVVQGAIASVGNTGFEVVFEAV